LTEEQVRLRAFPFTLADTTKAWLYRLEPSSITTWEQLKKQFLTKYFPAAKILNLRNQISTIRQKNTESIYDYWERFKHLVASCPQHQIPEQCLLNHFYNGLLPVNKGLMDATASGALLDQPTEQARKIITTMASSSQNFQAYDDASCHQVNEVGRSQLEQQLASTNHQLSKLTSLMMSQMGASSTSRPCGICSLHTHETDACPTLQEPSVEDVNSVGFPGPPRRNFDPFAPTYIPGWRAHPNLRYGNNVAPHFQPRPQFQQGPSAFQNRPTAPSQSNQFQASSHNAPPNQGPSSTPSSTSKLEDLVTQLASSQLSFQEATKS